MPELQTEELDVNTPISRNDEVDETMALASAYFEDYLFRLRTDLQALNSAVDALIASTTAYTPTNVTDTRSYDADSTSTAELADVLGTLIADLQAKGIIS